MTRFSPMSRAAALLPVLMFSLFLLMTPQARAADDPATCDASSLNGKYLVKVHGDYYDNDYYPYFFYSQGFYTFDGGGNFTGNESINNDGSASRRTVTGTYTLNSDCTGTLTTTGSDNVNLHFDIVVDGAKLVSMISTDSLTVIPGTATKQ